MKVFVLLSLVALCYSQSAYSGKYISIKDGNILVGVQGELIELSRSQMNPKGLDMVFRSPYEGTKMIQVGEPMYNFNYHTVYPKLLTVLKYIKTQVGDFTQFDVLLHLFREYEGFVNEDQYDNMLERLFHLVQCGVVNKSLFDVLGYFSLKHQQIVAQYEQFLPHGEQYGQFSPEHFEQMIPFHRFQGYLEQPKYQQYQQEFMGKLYPQQLSYQHQNVELPEQFEATQNIYGQYQHPYSQYQAIKPWTKFFSYMKFAPAQQEHQQYWPVPFEGQKQEFPQWWYLQKHYPQFVQQHYPELAQQHYPELAQQHYPQLIQQRYPQLFQQHYPQLAQQQLPVVY